MKSKFLTSVQRDVYKVPIFKTLIELFPQVDYRLEKYGERVAHLYQKLENAKNVKDQDMVDSIYETLSTDFKVSFNEQAAILIRILLKLCEQNELFLGFINDKTHFYNGKNWEYMAEKIFAEFLSEIAIRSGIDEYISKQNGKKDILLLQFKSEAIIAIQADKKVKINLKNGTFVLNPAAQYEFKLIKHNSNNGFLYALEFGYDPNARAPLFSKFLDRILPDKISQEVVLQFLAYSLTNLHYEKMLFAVGTGANGKSTLINIATKLLGRSNISSYTAQKLTDSSGYYRAKVAGKLLNCSPEFGANQVDYETLKKMVSNETVDARSPYREPFEFNFMTRLWFNLNSLPYVESIVAIKRRILLVPFEVTIPKEEQNPNLEKEICEKELPGIFNMLLNALKQLIEQKGFSESKAISDAVDSYMRDNDNVSIFMDESNYIKSDSEKIRRDELFSQYRMFCQENGYSACASNKFGHRLRNLEYKVSRANQGYYYVSCVRQLTPDEEHNKKINDSDMSVLDKALHLKSLN